ncbi:MAG TPA: group III truncated hemoglobin [Cyclobacteriaceae bacterium]|jgi:hemoglobin|nr:group III truncated hemoglobin [Cyclobacteriaceae bacterium]
MNPDIETREHIVLMVNSFYEKVKTDPLLAPVFSDVNWPNHLPVMHNFWSSMLLGDRSYQGNPLQKHLPLKITREHFQRWLQLFKTTVDEHFEGEKAEETKMRAESIAAIFQFKMG